MNTGHRTIVALLTVIAVLLALNLWHGQAKAQPNPQLQVPERVMDMTGAGNQNEGLVFRVWNDGLIEYRLDPPSGPSDGWFALPMNPDAPLSVSIALASLRSGSLISVFRHYANGESDRIILTLNCTGDGCTVGVDNGWTFDW